MRPLLLAACWTLLFALLFLLIGMILLKKHNEIRVRVRDIRSDRTEKTVIRVRRVRTGKQKKGSTAARTRRRLEKLENELYDVGIRIPVQRFLALWVGVTVGLPLLLTVLGLGSVVAGTVAATCAAGPILFLRIKKNKRRSELEEQLVDAIGVLCNALRAGHSFQQAMNSISTEMDGPVSEEFGRVFRETQHGMTLSDSMDRMVERVGSDDLEMMCTAILIQREVGGNLSEVLENIAGTIRSRLSLKAEVKTRTASGRLSGYMVGALPVILLVAISVINPEYSGTLFSTSAGHIMLAVGAVMEVIGFVVIQKITTIKY